MRKNIFLILSLGILPFMSRANSVKQQRYLGIELVSGLNNQKFMLLAACRIAAKNNYVLIEPYLQPAEKGDFQILFSEIYDLQYFISKMQSHCKIVPFSKDIKPDVTISGKTLWHTYSEETEAYKQLYNFPFLDNLEMDFYTGLRLTNKNQLIVNDIMHSLGTHYVAIHMRIEDDWLAFSKIRGIPAYEKLYVSKEEIVEKYKLSSLSSYKKIYISTY